MHQQHQLPVTTLRFFNTAEVIIHNQTGAITNKNKSEITNAIKQLLDSPETLKNMGISAATHARTAFSPEAMIQKHIDLYRVL